MSTSTDMSPRWGWWILSDKLFYRHVAPLGLVDSVPTFGYRRSAPTELGGYLDVLATDVTLLRSYNGSVGA